MGADLVGGVKGAVSNFFVIGGEVTGGTKITEKMMAVDNSKLRITTDWDGLTEKWRGTF